MPRSGARVRLDTRALDRRIRETPEQTSRFLEAAANAMNTEIVLSFGESVSTPGDPPGVDTGALRASMRVVKVQRLRFEIRDGVLYGIHLELGTEKMAARPFITPVFERWRRREFGRFARESGFLT